MVVGEMEDSIIICDDDDDVQCIKQVVNLEPILIDLTESDEAGDEFEEPRVDQSDEATEEPEHPRGNQSGADADGPEHPQANQSDDADSEPERPPTPQSPEPQEQIVQQPAQPTMPNNELSMTNKTLGHEKTCKHNLFDRAAEEPENPPTNPSSNIPQEQTVQQPEKPKMSDHDLMMAQKALGNEKYKHNLFDDAIRIYKRANELAKKLGNTEMSAILHFNLAMTYFRLGSFEQAADECANAVKLNDNYLKAHLKRAEIYQRQCKFEEAVICYEHICELDSNNQDYAVLLNYAREAAKKTKKRDCFQILGLSPNFTPEDLKKSYRQQALSHHPDRHSHTDIVTRRIEEKYFKDASEAYTFIQLRYGYRR